MRSRKEKIFKYQHGLPFEEDLKKDLDTQKDRIESNKASMILIDGGVGQGKTTLAVHIADDIEGEPIDFDCQLALGGADFIKKLKICFTKNKRVIIYDEAGDFSSRGALSRFNHMLNRVFETYRAFKIIVILVLPSFATLDKSIFQKQIPRMLIHCTERGELYGNYSVYSLWHMFYILHKMKKLIVKSDAYRFTEPCKHGHFLDLPPERSKQLDIISTQNKKDILGSAEIQLDGLMNYNDLSKKLGRSVVWIKRIMNELKIKPKKIHKTMHYFDYESFDRIAEIIEVNDVRMGKEPKDD